MKKIGGFSRGFMSQKRVSEQADDIASTSEQSTKPNIKYRTFLVKYQPSPKPSSVSTNKSHHTDEMKSLIEEPGKFESIKRGLAKVIKDSSDSKSQTNKPTRQQPIRKIYKSPFKAKPVERRSREVHTELTQLMSTQLKPTQSRPAGKTIYKKKSPSYHTLNRQRSTIAPWTKTVTRNEAVSKPKKDVLFNKKKIICEPKAEQMEELQINETVSDSIHIEYVKPSSYSLSTDIITLAERSTIPMAAPGNYKQAESLQRNESIPEINVEFSESDKQEINDANQTSIETESLLEANPTMAMNSMNEGKPSNFINTFYTSSDLETHVEPQQPKLAYFNFMLTFFGFLLSDFPMLYFVSLGPSFQLRQQIVRISFYEYVDNVYMITIWNFWTWTTATEILILTGLIILAFISTYYTMNLYLLRNLELVSAHKAKYLLCIYYMLYLGTYVYKLSGNFLAYKYEFEKYSQKVLGAGKKTAEESKYFIDFIVLLETIYLCFISLITIRYVYHTTRIIMKNFFKPTLPNLQASVKLPPSEGMYNKKKRCHSRNIKK